MAQNRMPVYHFLAQAMCANAPVSTVCEKSSHNSSGEDIAKNSSGQQMPWLKHNLIQTQLLPLNLSFGRKMDAQTE